MQQNPLLSTKLYIPPVRPELVPRPRLIERLNAGLDRKLTLVSAPAGFGKTTLLSEWTAKIQNPESTIANRVAWLSLDEGDNDPSRFLAYLVAALQTTKGDLGQGLLAALQSPGAVNVEAILITLINEIVSLPYRLVLVLDDHHDIESELVDKALTFLLDHLPPTMHLVIASRIEPTLPLSRLRARGELTELRQADLRFTTGEAAAFLKQAIRLPVSPDDVRKLENRTEGWITGLQLAEAVGPAGHVTGLDLSPESLAAAEEIVDKAGLSRRIFFREGDAKELRFEDDTFDWGWSMDCVGYAPMEPLPLVREPVRVVKPGGTVALLAWSSEMLLPGQPLLEARLNATTAGLAPFAKGKKPESHFTRALGWYRDAGLENYTAQTFVGDAHAPLTADQRCALMALFQMRWPGVESELRPEDANSRHPLAEYQRLCLPESPDFILDLPDYYAFFPFSMFQGMVAEWNFCVNPGGGSRGKGKGQA